VTECPIKPISQVSHLAHGKMLGSHDSWRHSMTVPSFNLTLEIKWGYVPASLTVTTLSEAKCRLEFVIYFSHSGRNTPYQSVTV